MYALSYHPDNHMHHRPYCRHPYRPDHQIHRLCLGDLLAVHRGQHRPFNDRRNSFSGPLRLPEHRRSSRCGEARYRLKRDRLCQKPEALSVLDLIDPTFSATEEICRQFKWEQ